MPDIDYKKMGAYLNKSARTLERWEKEKPTKFALMLAGYLDEIENETKHLALTTTEVIVVASLKGGVGKSTVSDSLAVYLGDSVVLNLDISQETKDINACDTIDYINLVGKLTIPQIIEKLSTKYRYIIVDTPGDVTPEVQEAISLSTQIIIPMTIGKRAREKTKKTLETFFGNGSEMRGDYKIFFFFNAYINKTKRDQQAIKFKEMYKKFTCGEGITIESKVGSLDYSDAISTAEEEGKSIFKMAEENKGAYKSVLGKLSNLCVKIENHLEIGSRA